MRDCNGHQTSSLARIKFGAHLFGTQVSQSDVDYRSVFIPCARDILLQRAPALIERKRTKQHGERNTVGDVDDDSYSLQRYLDLVISGQVFALDMLFAPDWAFVEPCSPVWRRVQDMAPHIVPRDPAFALRYCRRQVRKYGGRDSHVSALQHVHALLEAGAQEYGAGSRLAVLRSQLEITVAEYASVSILTPAREAEERQAMFEICGKKFPYSSQISAAMKMIETMLMRATQQTAGMLSDRDIDWKALSHAVRVGHEALELMRCGRITFPRPEAAHLVAIKLGQVSYARVYEEIENLMEQVGSTTPAQGLAGIPDKRVADDFVVGVYADEVRMFVELCS